MAVMGTDPQFKSQYNSHGSAGGLQHPVGNIIPNTTYENNNAISALIDQRDNISVAGSEK